MDDYDFSDPDAFGASYKAKLAEFDAANPGIARTRNLLMDVWGRAAEALAETAEMAHAAARRKRGGTNDAG